MVGRGTPQRTSYQGWNLGILGGERIIRVRYRCLDRDIAIVFSRETCERARMPARPGRPPSSRENLSAHTKNLSRKGGSNHFGRQTSTREVVEPRELEEV